MKTAIPKIPSYRDLLGYQLFEEGESPRKETYIIYEYPDCFRKFNGKEWITIEKEKGMDLTIFDIEFEGK